MVSIGWKYMFIYIYLDDVSLEYSSRYNTFSTTLYEATQFCYSDIR